MKYTVHTTYVSTNTVFGIIHLTSMWYNIAAFMSLDETRTFVDRNQEHQYMGGSAILLVMLQFAKCICDTIQTPGEEEPVLVTL